MSKSKESNGPITSRPKIDIIEKSMKILQGFAIIIGIWATYNEYKKQNDEKNLREIERHEQTAREFRKHFYDVQFSLYAEACEVTSILATEEIGSPDYIEARKKFFRLFWGRLAIVEEVSVESGMVHFKNLLIQYENNPNEINEESLMQASLQLSHAARNYTVNVWLDSAERKNYN